MQETEELKRTFGRRWQTLAERNGELKWNWHGTAAPEGNVNGSGRVYYSKVLSNWPRSDRWRRRRHRRWRRRRIGLNHPTRPTMRISARAHRDATPLCRRSCPTPVGTGTSPSSRCDRAGRWARATDPPGTVRTSRHRWVVRWVPSWGLSGDWNHVQAPWAMAVARTGSPPGTTGTRRRRRRRPRSPSTARVNAPTGWITTGGRRTSSPASFRTTTSATTTPTMPAPTRPSAPPSAGSYRSCIRSRICHHHAQCPDPWPIDQIIFAKRLIGGPFKIIRNFISLLALPVES